MEDFLVVQMSCYLGMHMSLISVATFVAQFADMGLLEMFSLTSVSLVGSVNITNVLNLHNNDPPTHTHTFVYSSIFKWNQRHFLQYLFYIHIYNI